MGYGFSWHLSGGWMSLCGVLYVRNDKTYGLGCYGSNIIVVIYIQIGNKHVFVLFFYVITPLRHSFVVVQTFATVLTMALSLSQTDTNCLPRWTMCFFPLTLCLIYPTQNHTRVHQSDLCCQSDKVALKKIKYYRDHWLEKKISASSLKWRHQMRVLGSRLSHREVTSKVFDFTVDNSGLVSRHVCLVTRVLGVCIVSRNGRKFSRFSFLLIFLFPFSCICRYKYKS